MRFDDSEGERIAALETNLSRPIVTVAAAMLAAATLAAAALAQIRVAESPVSAQTPASNATSAVATRIITGRIIRLDIRARTFSVKAGDTGNVVDLKASGDLNVSELRRGERVVVTYSQSVALKVQATRSEK
jgi:hypothetical protein